MTTLDIEQEVEDVQKKLEALNNLAAYVHQQSDLNRKKAHLEKQFLDGSDAAEIADEVTRLQRLASEIRQFTEEKKFYQLKQVTDVTLDEVKSFHERFYEVLPGEIFESLEAGIKASRTSLNLMLTAVKRLGSINQLNEASSEKELRIWATNLEILGEEVENNLPFFSSEVFECLERISETVVLKSRKKEENAKTKREGYRRRLRFAAGFILNLVETAREEAVEEDEELFQDMQLLSRKNLDAIYEDDKGWNPQEPD